MENNYKEVISNKKTEADRLMTKEQVSKSNAAIHTASIASGVAGVIPIPVVDAVPITAAQVTMVLALGKIFDKKITESAAKGIIGAAAATFIGRNAVKLIPIAGSVVSAAVAAGVTEAIGWTVAVDFAKESRKDREYDSKADGDINDKETAEAAEVSERDTLVMRADEYISGEKKRKENKDDYKTLLSEIDKMVLNNPDDKELAEKYDELMKV
ncbi:MAG: DUF697 domain-containing protein [Lachnospiraceae bacterium]|nr:DUF697 domain-containing protein [Lachnospiraceae bacterium]